MRKNWPGILATVAVLVLIVWAKVYSQGIKGGGAVGADPVALTQLAQALGCDTPTELTLDTNGDLAIANSGCFDVDTFADAASDTFDGGGTCPAGTVFALRQENAARDVILSSSGMQVYGAQDQTLDAAGDIAYGFCAVANTPVISHFVDASGTVKISTLQVGSTPAPLTMPLEFVFYNGGSALADQQSQWLYVPQACTVSGVVMAADQSGSAVVDLWVDVHANFPPINADSITAAATPTLSTAQTMSDSTLTGWTTSVAAGSWMRATVEGAATSILQLTISVQCDRS